MIISNKKEQTRFMKFIVVGIISSIVDFGLMNLFTLAFNLSLVLSQAISFTVAVLNSFLWNRYWTYPDSRSKSVVRQLVQFTVVNVVGIAIRTPLISWLDNTLFKLLDNLSFPPLPLSNMVISQNAALAISILVVMMWNFFINRFWTYSDVSNEPENLNMPSSDVQKEELI
jgi:putative flippase GtrA